MNFLNFIFSFLWLFPLTCSYQIPGYLQLPLPVLVYLFSCPPSLYLDFVTPFVCLATLKLVVNCNRFKALDSRTVSCKFVLVVFLVQWPVSIYLSSSRNIILTWKALQFHGLLCPIQLVLPSLLSNPILNSRVLRIKCVLHVSQQ